MISHKIIISGFAAFVVFSSASVPLRCRLCCHIRERREKASVFWTCLERERDRSRGGIERDGERQPERRALKLPAAHSTLPHPPLLPQFHRFLLLTFTCPHPSLAREGEESTFRRYRCRSGDGVLAAPNPGSNPWPSARGDGLRRRHW